MADRLTMTEADHYALSKCPDGWFECRDHDLVHLKNSDYRLQRLEARGKVESKYEGEWPNSVKKYRKVNQ